MKDIDYGLHMLKDFNSCNASTCIHWLDIDFINFMNNKYLISPQLEMIPYIYSSHQGTIPANPIVKSLDLFRGLISDNLPNSFWNLHWHRPVNLWLLNFLWSRHGACSKAGLGSGCEVGRRSRTYHILTGSVLSVWTKVEHVLASTPGSMQSRMQIIRLRTEDGKRFIGKVQKNFSDNLLINAQWMEALSMMLWWDWDKYLFCWRKENHTWIWNNREAPESRNSSCL